MGALRWTMLACVVAGCLWAAASASRSTPRPGLADGAAVPLALAADPGVPPLFLPNVRRQTAAAWDAPAVVGGVPSSIAEDGSLLYVAYRGRVDTLDFGDPLHPRRVATASGPETDFAFTMAARGGSLAAVTCDDGPITTYDGLSCGHEPDPSVALRLLDTRSTAGPHWAGRLSMGRVWSGGLALADGFAYLCTDTGLAVADVRDPDRPTRVRALEGPCGPLAVVGGRLLSMPAGLLQVFELADPSAPVLVAQVDGEPDWLSVVQMAVAEPYVASMGFLLHGAQVSLWDAGDPLHPVRLSGLGYDRYMAPYGIGLAADRLFIGTYSVGTGAVAGRLWVLDLVDKRAPRSLGQADLGEWSELFTAMAGHGVAISQRGVAAVVDAASAMSPTVVARYGVPLTGRLDEAIGGGDRVYGRAAEALEVMDLSDVASPHWLGTVGLPKDVSSVALLAADRLLVGAGNTDQGGRVEVLDISNPASPLRLAVEQWDDAHHGPPLRIAAAGRRVVTVSTFWTSPESVREFALYSWDEQAPALRPVSVWRVDAEFVDWALAPDGLALYVLVEPRDAPGTARLDVFDLRDESAPVLSAELPVQGQRVALATSALLIAGHESVHVYELSSRFAPSPAGALPVEADAIATVASRQVVVAGGGLIRLLDVTDPAMPRVVRSASVPVYDNTRLTVAADRVWYWTASPRSARRLPGWFGFALEQSPPR